MLFDATFTAMHKKLWSLWGLGWLLAQGPTGDLVLISETGEPFRLYINGEWLSDAPVTRAEAHDLPEGAQRATIYIYPSEGRVIQLRRTLYVEAGMIEHYALRKRKRQYTIALYNRTPRQEETAPPAPPLPPAPPTAGTPPSQTPPQGQGTTIIFNPTIQVQTGSGTQISNSTSPNAIPASPTMPFPHAGSSYSGPCNCTFPISRESFAQALRTLRQETFDQTRLEIAKTIARQNCLLAQDVREMMLVFTFEDARLDLAKFAYDYTHDLANYFVVSEAFEFSSSKEDLMRYIQRRPARQSCAPSGGIGMPSPTAPVGGTPTPGTSCTPCMSAQSAAQAIATLKATASEMTRLEVAKQIVSTNCPSAQQVRDLCRTLTAENNRLELAKYAYTRTCDPQNYFLVNEALTSSLSQQELARYIQSLSGR